MKTIILIITIAMFFSCAIPESRISDYPDFVSIQDANNWIDNNIQYEHDVNQFGYKDYWQSPEQLLETKKGDCEDMAILLLKVAYDQFGYKGKIVMKTDGDRNHAIVDINGKEYNNVKGIDTIFNVVDYDTAMLLAYNNYKIK